MTNVRRGSIFGTFVHTDGSRWLVFAEPDPALGLALIFYAQPEPTAGEFFNEFFLRPLFNAGVLAVLLAMLLAAIIAQSVARPLGAIASRPKPWRVVIMTSTSHRKGRMKSDAWPAASTAWPPR